MQGIESGRRERGRADPTLGYTAYKPTHITMGACGRRWRRRYSTRQWHNRMICMQSLLCRAAAAPLLSFLLLHIQRHGTCPALKHGYAPEGRGPQPQDKCGPPHRHPTPRTPRHEGRKERAGGSTAQRRCATTTLMAQTSGPGAARPGRPCRASPWCWRAPSCPTSRAG